MTSQASPRTGKDTTASSLPAGPHSDTHAPRVMAGAAAGASCRSGQPIRWRGIKHDGTGATGSSYETAATLAEWLFDRGYRKATITDEQGEEIGGVGRRADDGVRDWWGAR